MALLGCLLLDPQAVAATARTVRIEDFYDAPNRAVYGAILEASDGGRADEVTVCDILGEELRGIGGREFLHELSVKVPSAANAEQYARIVSKHALARRVIKACQTGLREAEDSADPDEVASKAIESIQDAQRHVQTKAISIGDALLAVGEGARERWGILDLPILQDKLTGLYPGGITLLAGPPGAGKTTLCMQLIAQVAETGHKVYVWSKDQPEGELSLILWAGLDDVFIDDLWQKGDFARVSALPIDYAPGPFTLPNVCSTIRALSAEGTRWFLIDYLSLLGVPGHFKAEWEKSAYAGKQLKLVAQETNVYLLVIQSSIKPETEVPHVKYISGGQELQHAADVILWMEPPKMGAKDDLTDIYLFKTRKTGACKKIGLRLVGAKHRFEPEKGLTRSPRPGRVKPNWTAPVVGVDTPVDDIPF